MRVRREQVEQMIKYEDEAVLVVHKPPYLAVETKNFRQQDLVSLLKNRRVELGEAAYIGLVHRLDQPVEGLLVLAKTQGAAAVLSAGLGSGDFIKEYLAVVQGITSERETLRHTLKKDGRTNTSAVVPEGAAGGKEARLSYERLAVADEKSLLCIRLDTGRHHQIRVQLAAIGHPLCGDVKYGEIRADAGGIGSEACGGINGYEVNRGHGQASQPLALCSSHLSFVHPATGERMEFFARPVGTGFAVFTEALAKE